MLSLEKKEVWKQLEGPYGSSEALPNLLKKLDELQTEEEKKTLADVIVWEHIYHQDSVYQNTIATFPHLLKVALKSETVFKMDLLLSLGIVLTCFDLRSDFFNFFESSLLKLEEVKALKEAFIGAINVFKEVVFKHFQTQGFKEIDKVYVLVTLLFLEGKTLEAEVFKTFCYHDEYMFACPSCKTEIFLWNEKEELNAYKEDPVFNERVKVQMRDSELNYKGLEQIEAIVQQIDLKTLKPMLPYFKQVLTCHVCKKESIVFEGIKGAVSY